MVNRHTDIKSLTQTKEEVFWFMIQGMVSFRLIA